jgi:hypothetical protein
LTDTLGGAGVGFAAIVGAVIVGWGTGRDICSGVLAHPAVKAIITKSTRRLKLSTVNNRMIDSGQDRGAGKNLQEAIFILQN